MLAFNYHRVGLTLGTLIHLCRSYYIFFRALFVAMCSSVGSWSTTADV